MRLERFGAGVGGITKWPTSIASKWRRISPHTRRVPHTLLFSDGTCAPKNDREILFCAAMRSVENDSPLLDTNDRLSALSIVVDDFDSMKSNGSNGLRDLQSTSMPDISLYQPPPRPYTRQSSDASIKKILEEAEHRKHEFCKLLDEHTAVVENLKKIEQMDSHSYCKLAQHSPIST